MQALLRGGAIQAKLEDGLSSDAEKQEGVSREAPGTSTTAGREAPDAIEHSAGQPLDARTRAVLEPRFGYNFSQVRIHTDSAAAASAQSIHALAYAAGEDIVFAPQQYEPSTERGQRLLAHELAHVVQQQHGLAGKPQAESRGLEAAAERDAHVATAGGRVQLPARAGPATPAVQKFDPAYHEEAVIGGLTGIFTPAEIGKIYEANWRRDFSQGPPIIGDIVLTWKELRDKAAATGHTDLGLQYQLLSLITRLPHDMAFGPGESYGGYRYWEHMDNPGGTAAADADTRWGGGGAAGGQIAGYIRDSRASIKEKLATAILIARMSWGGSPADAGQTRADAWASGTPPATYDMFHPYAGRTLPPQSYGVAKNVSDPTHSSGIVAKEVEDIAAGKPGHIADPTKTAAGFGADPAVADNLGRASHLIEDFFAHSNFVELAAQKVSGQTITPDMLKTGTFEAPDKAHSLAGKLRDAAAEMRAHRNLIPLVNDAAIQTLETVAAAAEATSKALGPKPGSHTLLAKDSPRAQGFAMAIRLAASADQMIFFWVHRTMQDRTPDRALKDTYILFELVDMIVNIPSDHHPLKSVYGGP